MSYPSESFERYIVPALFEPWARQLLQFSPPPAGARVLDVACGTGIVARRIAPLVSPNGSVLGIDFNPNMVRVARQVAASEGVRIDVQEGRAENLPFGQTAFDLVTCQFGLMLFSNPLLALGEIRRVLRPEGRVALSVWQAIDRHPFYQRLHEASVRRLGMSVVGDIYSLGDAARLQRLLATAGFHELRIEPVTITASFAEPEQLLAWELAIDPQSVPSMREADGSSWQAVMAALRPDIRPSLEAAIHGGDLVLDFHAYLARGERSAGGPASA